MTGIFLNLKQWYIKKMSVRFKGHSVHRFFWVKDMLLWRDDTISVFAQTPNFTALTAKPVVSLEQWSSSEEILHLTSIRFHFPATIPPSYYKYHQIKF